jgi:mannosyltransferase OCH1-like enzyme
VARVFVFCNAAAVLLLAAAQLRHSAQCLAGVRGGGNNSNAPPANLPPHDAPWRVAQLSESHGARLVSWRVGAPLGIEELTQSPYSSCSTDGKVDNNSLVYVADVPGPGGAKAKSAIAKRPPTTVPPVIHQTSKSRCVTPTFASAAQRWKDVALPTQPGSPDAGPVFEYYLHDDEAVRRLLENMSSEFPLVELVSRSCVTSGAILSDLWRYVVLWKYGGIYTDIDTVPGPNFRPDAMLKDGVDGLFVVEREGMLSQYFMAVSPRHPIMYYAIQHTLSGLLQAPDTGDVRAPQVTGPWVLHKALKAFVADAGGWVAAKLPDNKPVKAGTYVGTHNRSVTAIGTWDNANDYVRREVIGLVDKKAEYDKMEMEHFTVSVRVRTKRSCMKAMFDEVWHPPTRHEDAA